MKSSLIQYLQMIQKWKLWRVQKLQKSRENSLPIHYEAQIQDLKITLLYSLHFSSCDIRAHCAPDPVVRYKLTEHVKGIPFCEPENVTYLKYILFLSSFFSKCLIFLLVFLLIL